MFNMKPDAGGTWPVRAKISRIAFFYLAVMLTLSIIPGGIIARRIMADTYIAPFEGQVRVSVAGASAAPGEYVDVSINLSENSGVTLLNMSVGYDENILERVGITVTGNDLMILPLHPPDGDNPFRLNFEMIVTTDIVTDTGRLAVVRFRVREGAQEGATNIELSVQTAYVAEGFAHTRINASASNGTVYVTAPEPSPPPEESPTPSPPPEETPTPSPSPPPVNNNARVSVNNVSAYQGSYVDVGIYLNENDGITNLIIDVAYNYHVLQRTGIHVNNLLQVPELPPGDASPSFRLNFTGTSAYENFTGTGRLATIRFRVFDQAPLGGSPVRLSVHYSNVNVDGNFHPVNVTTTNGSVYVWPAEPPPPPSPTPPPVHSPSPSPSPPPANITLYLNPYPGVLPSYVGNRFVGQPGFTIPSFPVPTRQGYHFAGWMHNNTRVNAPFAVGHNMTLYASWTPATSPTPTPTPAPNRVVIFQPGPGASFPSGETGIRTVHYGTRVYAPRTPTRPGHSFAGWRYNNHSVNFPITVRYDMTLTAAWTATTPSPTHRPTPTPGQGHGHVNPQTSPIQISFAIFGAVMLAGIALFGIVSLAAKQQAAAGVYQAEVTRLNREKHITSLADNTTLPEHDYKE